MNLRSTFGPLEIKVLEALEGVAYTTLMTTLDRLFRKGTLTRVKSGRAFFYQPKASHQALISELAGSTFATMLPGDAASVRPILSMFVDTVGNRDQALLDELEALVKARRSELKGRSSK
jgi:predicted transcriptional regulator